MSDDRRDDAERLTEIREAVEEDFRLFGEPTKLRTTGRYEATHLLRQFDTTIAAKDAEIATLRAENERFRSKTLEEAARWHEGQRPRLSGPEYGLASLEERKEMRIEYDFHTYCAMEIRALIPPQEPQR